MDYNIVFTPKAGEDIKAIFEFYQVKNENTARKYYYGIIERIEHLKDQPKIGRIVPEFLDEFYDKYRELIYEKFRILYRIDGGKIFVIRIIDGRKLLDLSIL